MQLAYSKHFLTLLMINITVHDYTYNYTVSIIGLIINEKIFTNFKANQVIAITNLIH